MLRGSNLNDFAKNWEPSAQSRGGTWASSASMHEDRLGRVGVFLDARLVIVTYAMTSSLGMCGFVVLSGIQLTVDASIRTDDPSDEDVTVRFYLQ